MKGYNLKQLLEDNKAAVIDYNHTIYPYIAYVSLATVFTAIIFSFFQPDMKVARLMYILIFVYMITLFLVSKMKKMYPYITYFMYLHIFGLYGLVLYLSLFVSKSRSAGCMLILLAIFPVIFLDNPRNLIGINIVLYLIQGILSCYYKGTSLGTIDAINGFTAMIFGCALCWITIGMRLRSFDLERLLTAEKDSDILTGLYNRRKLFNVIAEVESQKQEKPTAVLMLDIDFFKQYNDKFGHAAGDECLRELGKLLRNANETFKTEFYRYGGEEFVGFIWNANKESLDLFAEKIRKSVSEMQLENDKITVSVGTVFCDGKKNLNYESWIRCADVALYKAKTSGRNRVVKWSDDFKK